ncbi:MAG: NAD(P)H-quinone oxidoreductase [Alphaproteobacteria bacterium]
MRAVKIENQQLVLKAAPVPKPGKGEVLVRVRAAGINRPDLLQRKGLYPPPPGVTDIPGLELSGEIVALGRSVKGFRRGQAVCALVAGGGYAEYCAVPAVQCLPIPKGLNFLQAACLPETFFTVWTNLFDRGQLKKGESLLIHGGSSGIGTTAIQVAKAFGAKVAVTAGTDEKCRACLKLGARFAINYKTQDFVAEIGNVFPGGVNIILDMVGGDYLQRNLRALAPYGRHVSIAMQRGRNAEIDIFQVMSKRLILTGSTLRPQPVSVKGAIAKALKKSIWPLLAQKKIKPVVDRVFPLEEAQNAHDYLESGHHFGKIVLKVRA